MVTRPLRSMLAGMPAHDTLVVNAGTGAFVLLPTGDSRRSHPELLSGLSRSDGHTADYYLEGTVNGAASALERVANQYRIADWPAQAPGWLDQIEVPPVFLNSIGGLGSPWWQPGPDPVFLPDGNGAQIEPAQAMAAAIESIVFLIQANVELLCELTPGMQGIRISGGLAPLDGLCRKLANLSGLAVERSGAVESTARGIAWLAAGCPDSWEPPGVERRFLPQEDPQLSGPLCAFPRRAGVGTQAGCRKEQQETGVVETVQQDGRGQRLVAVLEEPEYQRGEEHQRRPQRGMVQEMEAGKNQAGKQIGEADRSSVRRLMNSCASSWSSPRKTISSSTG